MSTSLKDLLYKQRSERREWLRDRLYEAAEVMRTVESSVVRRRHGNGMTVIDGYGFDIGVDADNTIVLASPNYHFPVRIWMEGSEDSPKAALVDNLSKALQCVVDVFSRDDEESNLEQRESVFWKAVHGRGENHRAEESDEWTGVHTDHPWGGCSVEVHNRGTGSGGLPPIIQYRTPPAPNPRL